MQHLMAQLKCTTPPVGILIAAGAEVRSISREPQGEEAPASQLQHPEVGQAQGGKKKGSHGRWYFPDPLRLLTTAYLGTRWLNL